MGVKPPQFEPGLPSSSSVKVTNISGFPGSLLTLSCLCVENKNVTQFIVHFTHDGEHPVKFRTQSFSFDEKN